MGFFQVAAGSTKAAITAHLATQRNTADVQAKEGAQETLVTLCGMLLGVSARVWWLAVVLGLVQGSGVECACASGFDVGLRALEPVDAIASRLCVCVCAFGGGGALAVGVGDSP
jgi:hypothetical protein